MDANDITLILDNDQGTYEWVYGRCVDALTNSPDINVLEDEDTRKNYGHDYYQTVGNEVREIVAEIIGVDDVVSGSVQWMFLTQTLDNVSWYDVGQHYYDTTVERWVYENENEESV